MATTNLTRSNMENILQFCFATFFTFDQKLVANRTEFSSTDERDSALEPLSSTVGSEAWNSRDLKSRPH